MNLQIVGLVFCILQQAQCQTNPDALDVHLHKSGRQEKPPAIAQVSGPVRKWQYSDRETEGLRQWANLRHSARRDDYSISLDRTKAFRNEPSVRIESNHVDPADYASIYQTFNANTYRGKRLRFGADISTANAEGGATLWMKVDGNDSTLAFDGMGDRAIEGTTDWKPVRIVLDVPEAARTITIGFSVKGPGTGWVSHFSLEPVSKTVASTAVPIAQAKEYVTAPFAEPHNLNFEEVGTAPDQIVNWGVHEHGDFKALRDTSITYGGNNSARISATNDQPKGFASVDQDVGAEHYRGHRVKYSAQVKTKDATDWVGLWMRVDGRDHILGFDNMEKRPIKGTTDWKEYSVVLDVPQQAHKLKIGMMHSGPGDAWFTASKLQTVSNDIPVTGEQVTGTAQVPEEVYPSKPDLRLGGK